MSSVLSWSQEVPLYQDWGTLACRTLVGRHLGFTCIQSPLAFTLRTFTHTSHVGGHAPTHFTQMHVNICTHPLRKNPH